MLFVVDLMMMSLLMKKIKKMSKAKLVGMICKEQLQMLEENPPRCPRSKGIKKVLTPYSFIKQKYDKI